jgi:hypothetical protein
MAYFPALELITKHKIGEKLMDIHCGESRNLVRQRQYSHEAIYEL